MADGKFALQNMLKLLTFSGIILTILHAADTLEKDTKKTSNDKMVPVKIVEEPAVLKGYGYGVGNTQSQTEKILTARVEPQPFLGPAHFSPLVGKCFTLIDNSYKYEVCPFKNVTQREQSIRWNAFQGILGIWHEWIIVNNTLEGMLMKEGELCVGGTARQTKVLLRCGLKNILRNAREPSTCHYEIELQTPLACPEDALLVYPFLTEDGQKEWEEIEKELYLEELTQQGYHKRRTKLFQKEGFLANPRNSATKMIPKVDEPANEKKENIPVEKSEEDIKSSFKSLEDCSKAYEDLLLEVTRLRELLNKTANYTLDKDSKKRIVSTNGNSTTSRVDGFFENKRMDSANVQNKQSDHIKGEHQEYSIKTTKQSVITDDPVNANLSKNIENKQEQLYEVAINSDFTSDDRKVVDKLENIRPSENNLADDHKLRTSSRTEHSYSKPLNILKKQLKSLEDKTSIYFTDNRYVIWNKSKSNIDEEL